ncbi:hypothetical protein Bca4012_088822 [Brassica carinata]
MGMSTSRVIVLRSLSSSSNNGVLERVRHAWRPSSATTTGMREMSEVLDSWWNDEHIGALHEFLRERRTAWPGCENPQHHMVGPLSNKTKALLNQELFLQNRVTW